MLKNRRNMSSFHSRCQWLSSFLRWK